jgi:hypothetical protein
MQQSSAVLKGGTTPFARMGAGCADVIGNAIVTFAAAANVSITVLPAIGFLAAGLAIVILQLLSSLAHLHHDWLIFRVQFGSPRRGTSRTVLRGDSSGWRAVPSALMFLLFAWLPMAHAGTWLRGRQARVCRGRLA